MFYWNEEEFANIVWGEAGDSDDHIVPYQKGSEDYDKDLNHDSSRQAGQDTRRTKNEARGRKLDGDSNFTTTKGMAVLGFCMDSWPEPLLSSATKTGQNCVGTEVSKNVNETTKYGSSGATFELFKDPEIFESLQQSKEEGEFVDDGWTNIRSFDDFDRVFSNDDDIFGSVSIDNDEGLWPSSKDTSEGPTKSLLTYPNSPSLELGMLTNASEHLGLGIKTEEMQDDESFNFSYEKMDDPSYHSSHNSNATLDHVEYAGDKSNSLLKQTDLGVAGKGVAGKAIVEKPNLTSQNVVTSNEFADKTYRPRKLMKREKTDERSGGKVLQDLHGGWSSPGNTSGQLNQLAPSMVQSHSPSVLGQHRNLQGPESLHNPHVTNQFMPPSAYGNPAHPYPITSLPSHLQSGELKHQHFLYGYEASPVNAISPNMSTDTSLKHQTMTPQEKIEKLRRRQQMQAMLAIKKQQQQFNHQTFSTDDCIIQNCPRDKKTQHVEGADLQVEYLSNLPSLDPSSTIDHDESNAMSTAVNGYSWEEITLNQLQDTVAKLDMSIRVSIRDSLFRLGHSALQRQYTSYTSSTGKSSRDEHGISGKQETNNTTRMTDAETKTNHIDRTVAHLLFHRNLEIPESPSTTKIPCDRKTTGLQNLPMGCLPENTKTKQTFSHQGSEDPCPLAEPQHVDQFKTNPYLEVSEITSITGPADGETMGVEASQ